MLNVEGEGYVLISSILLSAIAVCYILEPTQTLAA